MLPPPSSSPGNLSGTFQNDYNHLEAGNPGISPIEDLNNNSDIESSSKYEGRTWSLISAISQIGKFIGNTLYFCLISPFVIVACKIYEITKEILNSFNDDSKNLVESKATLPISKTKSDLNKGLGLNSSPSTTKPLSHNSKKIDFELHQGGPLVINSEVVQLSNEASQIIKNPRITINIPAQGNCLFCAIFAGLKLVYANNEKKRERIANKLNDNIAPNQLNTTDLTTDYFIGLLKAPAKALRELAANSIASKLNSLKQNVIQTLENCDNDLPSFEKPNKHERSLLTASTLIRDLKDAIEDHNESMDKKIKYHTDVCNNLKSELSEIQKGEAEFFQHLQLVKMSLSNKPNDKKLKNEKKGYEEIIETYKKSREDKVSEINRNLEERDQWKNKKINCSSTGFKACEIPELMRYVREFMKQDMHYANILEIRELSHYFQIPIIVQPIYKVEEKIIYGERHDFNPQLLKGTKPVVLELQNQHYNLSIDLP